MILPVAALGLLGAGVGAFAYGGEPSSDSAAFVTTHAEAAPRKPGAVPRGKWVRGANAACRSTAEQLRALGRPKDREAAIVYFDGAADATAGLASALEELGWPKGKKADARRLADAVRKQARLLPEAIEALRQGREDRGLFALLQRLDARSDALSRKLGVTACRNADFDRKAYRTDAKRSAAERLENALVVSRAAVVVLYTPGGGVDNAAVRESRAGAVAADAGFVSVNVTKNGAVASLFEEYGARQAPAVLVFVHGPKLAAHFDGFADRDTVAQAVTNALR